MYRRSPKTFKESPNVPKGQNVRLDTLASRYRYRWLAVHIDVATSLVSLAPYTIEARAFGKGFFGPPYKGIANSIGSKQGLVVLEASPRTPELWTACRSEFNHMDKHIHAVP